MDDRLLVPATRALLEGWCGPVVWLPPGIPATWDGRVRVLCYRHGGVVNAWDWPEGGPDTLALDLSRAECRDRVARVLARKMVFLDGSTVAPPFDRYLSGWRIGSENRMWRQVDTSAEALDPHDDTRLPDGSRWVDAAALAAVAREVLRG